MMLAVAGAALVLAGTAAPADAHPAASSASETVSIVFAGAPGKPGTVIAYGAVTDIGTITPTDGDVDTYVFPDGTLAVRLSVSTTVGYPRPPSCVTTFRSTGTFLVVGGTGRFAGASGSGTASDAGFTAGPGRDCYATPPVFVADYATLHGLLTK